jgi:pyruvate/2-oxoglutarate dehydrogenase complex dihydrolipoamide acyltransferase (E2) component
VDTKGGVIRPIVRNPHLKVIETVANEMRDLARKSRRTDPEELYRRAARVYVWTALRELDFRAIQAGWILLRALLWSQWRPDPGYQAIPEEDKLQVSDILGATCTVANIGMMVPGVQTVTVIVPPEVMLFGIGDLHQAPCVVDGKVVPRYVISMSATMDHRAFDAGEAFPFYEHLKRYIDNPALIYEWKPGDPL